jgi:hypothetical protein
MLAHHGYSRGGECWPSIPTLAAETGLSRCSVKRAIAKLVTRPGVGLRLSRTLRPKPGTRHDSNLYRLAIREGGVGLTQHPTWGSGRAPNRISETSLISGTYSPLEISDPSFLPPKRQGGKAIVSHFVQTKLVDQARSQWPNEHPTVVRSQLGKLLAAGFTDKEVKAWLRRAARDPTVARGDRPLFVACLPERFAPWLKEHREALKPEPVEPTHPPTSKVKLAERSSALLAALHRKTPASTKQRPRGA